MAQTNQINKTVTIEPIKKEILIGKNSNNYAVILGIDTYEGDRFTISGTEYDLNDVFNSEQGEEKARDYLEDGELWKMAVEADNTTDSLEDFNNEVINIDGWEHVLGDVEYIDNDLYCLWGSWGQIRDSPDKDIKQGNYLITQKELNLIMKMWDKYHLKDVEKLSTKDIKQINKVIEIFKKYPSYEGKQLMQFVNQEDNE